LITRLTSSLPDARAIYVAGSKALYRSDNGGQTWAPVAPSPPEGHLAGGADGRLLLVGDVHTFQDRPSCGASATELPGVPLQRSTDDGLHWYPVTGDRDQPLYIRPVAIWTQSPLALGMDCHAVQVSADGGATWMAISLPDSSFNPTAVTPLQTNEPESASALVIGTSEGGTSGLWRLDLAPSAPPHFSPGLLDFWSVGAPAGWVDGSGASLYIVGSATGVHLSMDEGASWRDTRSGLEAVTLSVDPLQDQIPESEKNRYGIFTVTVDPAEPDHLYAGTVDGVYVSDDRGVTWKQMLGSSGTIHELLLATRGQLLFAETSDEVVRLQLP
jgi:photosystem II stability/assembly factor-like uncharacterized protein